jgi:hypothetical protein
MTQKKSKKSGQRIILRARPVRQTPTSEGLQEQIARRAYELYERRIRQGPLDDWLQAEQEILKLNTTRNNDKPHRGGYASEEQN